MPKVSVITPVYNAGPYLTIAIRSLQRQSFRDFELIIVDDGSTEEIGSTIPRGLPRSTIIHQTRQGVSTARNVGLSAAGGKYVAFLDADDIWYPDKLATQVDVMDAEPQVGLCHTGYEIIGANGGVLMPGPRSVAGVPLFTDSRVPGRNIRGAFSTVVNRAICLSSVMLRRDALQTTGVFDAHLTLGEDIELWCRILVHYKLACIPWTQVSYRLHSGNSTLRYETGLQQALQIFSRYVDRAANEEGDDLLDLKPIFERTMRRYFAHCALRHSLIAAHEFHWASSVLHVARAMMLEPRVVFRSNAWGALMRLIADFRSGS